MSQAPQGNKFPFHEHIVQRFSKWTGLTDEDIAEALKDLTGDTYFEMRKLISILLTYMETLIEEGKYVGFIHGNELTETQKESIKDVKEDAKEHIRTAIESSWRAILNKQKLGVDKLSLSLKPHLNNDNSDKKD